MAYLEKIIHMGESIPRTQDFLVPGADWASRYYLFNGRFNSYVFPAVLNKPGEYKILERITLYAHPLDQARALGNAPSVCRNVGITVVWDNGDEVVEVDELGTRFDFLIPRISISF
jgi:hypothetical protein